MDHDESVDADPHFGIVGPGSGALDDDVVLFPPFAIESSSSGETFLGEHVFLFEEQNRVQESRSRFGPLVSFFPAVSEQKHDLFVADESDVEVGTGLGTSGGEFSRSDIPEDLEVVGIDVDGFVAFFAPEMPGFEVDLAGIVEFAG